MTYRFAQQRLLFRSVHVAAGLLLVLVLFSAAACSGSSDSPEPTSTPDVPSATASDVWGALKWHVERQRHAGQHYLSVGCSLRDASYEGHGFWRCGDWVYNEITGEVRGADGQVHSTRH
jgi:hypothetical protein